MALDALVRSNTITGMRESDLESAKQYLRKFQIYPDREVSLVPLGFN